MLDAEQPLHADYVVVGGGSAGAAVASRLSESDGTHVVLIEAGSNGRHWMVEIPVGYVKLVGNPRTDWCYTQEPDGSIENRTFIWSAGRMLGGSSSINGQVYVRGTRRDFDRWANAGATGWGFDDVLPFFKASETWTGLPSSTRGVSGPLTVSPMRPGYHPLTNTFVKVCNEFGLKTLPDCADGDMEGVFYTQASQRRGWRCSTEKAYLRSNRRRKNLSILTNAMAEGIIVENGRAVGVTCSQNGHLRSVRARSEVIVCAGAIGTPALLMRSGIGPARHLLSLGIKVVKDVEGVGQNLHEHPGVGQNKYVNRPTLNSRQRPIDMLGYFARFGWNRTGPLASPAVPAMALVRSRDGLDEPDLQIHFMPLGYDLASNDESWNSSPIPTDQIVTLYVSLCQPRSRGRVELDASRKPKIVHRLLGDDRDVQTLIAGCRLIDRLCQMPSMRKLITANRNPDPIPQTDDEWRDYIRKKVALGYHPVGTCRMGSDAGAVVDVQLRVRGVAGLRIADASIMPSITSANTNAASIMIGEKAASIIQSSNAA